MSNGPFCDRFYTCASHHSSCRIPPPPTLRGRGLNSWQTNSELFFFQAEDGIRDGHVTGVQTCALPILHYGEYEGQPTEQAGSKVADHIKNRPNEPMPGVSKFSGDKGESYNVYKRRVLPAVQAVIKIADAHPNESFAVVLNGRTIKMIQAWQANGSPDDFSTDNVVAAEKSNN